MKVVVFGAAGRIGRLVVQELCHRGHSVVAYVHHDEAALHRDGVEVVVGDVRVGEHVEQAVAGADIVISCLGSWGTPTKDILSRGMEHIVPAMQASHSRRIISLTGADAWQETEQPNLLQKMMHMVFGLVAGPILRDGEAHLKTLAASALEWTVLRSVVMSDGGRETYELSERYPLPGKRINRHAVAVAMVDQIERRDYIGKAPFVC